MSSSTPDHNPVPLGAAIPWATGVHMPEIVVYVDKDYGGGEWRTNLSYSYVGDFWNDKISAIVVVSGTWRFWQDKDFKGNHWDLGPGYYPWVVAAGIPNDTISSFQAISV